MAAEYPLEEGTGCTCWVTRASGQPARIHTDPSCPFHGEPS